MRRPIRLLLGGVLACVTCHGQAYPHFPLDPLVVESTQAEEVPAGAMDLAWHYQGLPGPTYEMLAGQLSRMPGIDFEKRGAAALSPGLRGFSADRVDTLFNGVYLPVASPTGTASPVNFFGPLMGGNVRVTSAFQDVTMGPAPAGGTLAINTMDDVPSGRRMFLSAASNPEGWIGSVLIEPLQGARKTRFSGDLYAIDRGDYTAGEGDLTVGNTHRAWGLNVSLNTKAGNFSGVQAAFSYQHLDKASNPSLPMDTIGTDALFTSLRGVLPCGRGNLIVLAGYARIDPRLSTRDRLIVEHAPLAGVSAASSAESLSGKVHYIMDDGRPVRIEGGFDHRWQFREGERHRALKSGSVLVDPIWPGLEERQWGAFLQLSGAMDSQAAWQLGARVQRCFSRIRYPELPVIGIPGSAGPTVRDNFIAYNGIAAGVDRSRDWTGSLQGQFRKPLTGNWQLILQGGVTRSVPGPAHRYRAFLGALGGGVEVGNPALRPEQRVLANLCLNYRGAHWNFVTEIWAARVDGYIQRRILSADPLVYGFRNGDATLGGADAFLMYSSTGDKNGTGWQATLAVSSFFGEDRRTGHGLPETGAVKVRAGWSCRWKTIRLQAGWAYTAGRNNPSPEVNPIYRDTASHHETDLAVTVHLAGDFQFTAGVRNLWDSYGSDYLQPPAVDGAVLPPGSNLKPGSAVPLPGRSLHLALSRSY